MVYHHSECFTTNSKISPKFTTNHKERWLHLRYSDSASWFSPIFWRASVTVLQVGFSDFLTHMSSTSLRHSSSPSWLVKISSSRSSSIPSFSPNFCHLGFTEKSSVKRLSELREHCWPDGGLLLACPTNELYSNILCSQSKV